MTTINIPRSDFLNTIAQYRSGVEAQKGANTPFPDLRETELQRLDGFTKSVLADPLENVADMLSAAQSKASTSLATFNAWNKTSYFGGLGAMLVGYSANVFLAASAPALGTAGLALAAVGGIGLFVGQGIARLKAAEYNQANSYADKLQTFADFYVAKNSAPGGNGNTLPPGVGPNATQPAVCAQPPLVGS